MSNSALDNLFLMPTPLPAGSAALPLTSGDRRDFDNALERAYQPAAPQVKTDASAHLTDTRRLARDENGIDARSADNTSHHHERNGDQQPDPKPTNRENRAGDHRPQRDKLASTASAKGSQNTPALRGKSKAADKKEAASEESVLDHAEPGVQQAPTNPSAIPQKDAIPNVATSDAAVDSAQIAAGTEVKNQPVQQTPDATAPVVDTNCIETGAESKSSLPTTDAKTELIASQTKLELANASAKLKSAAAKSQPAAESVEQVQARSQSAAADQAKLATPAPNAQQVEAGSSQTFASAPSESRESPRPKKATGLNSPSLAENAEEVDDAARQLNPAAAATATLMQFDAPLAATQDTSAAVKTDTTKSSDDDSPAKTDVAANQPASLTDNRFADAVRDSAANLPGHIAPSNGSGKTNIVGEPRGANQVDQARFVQRVAKAFRTADDQGGQIRIRLSPPELGSLKLEITLRNGVMTAKLETETNSARTLLLDNLPTLRQRLADQNIKIERFDVDLRQDGRGDGSPNPPPDFSGAKQNLPRSFNAGRIGRATASGVESTTSNGDSRALPGDGRLNVVI